MTRMPDRRGSVEQGWRREVLEEGPAGLEDREDWPGQGWKTAACEAWTSAHVDGLDLCERLRPAA